MDLSSLTPDKQVKLQYWLDVIRQSERGRSQCRNLYTGRDSESEWACPDEIYKIYPVRHAGECFS